MNKDFFENIVNNLNIPVAVFKITGKILYANSAFKKSCNNTNNCTLDMVKDLYKDALSVQNIKTNSESYVMVSVCENPAHQEFISTVSHELRTPLTSIRGFADTMLMAGDKLSSEQQNKFLNIIRNQADRLTRLVENLLEVSNVFRKDKFVFKEINFENLIAQIITIFEKKYTTRKFLLSLQRNLPEIWADSDATEQIMTNLIDNAAKYSQDGAIIKIQADFKNDYVEIKVIDEAVKIPETKLSQIFNKFSRIDNPLTRKVEGSGLGLYITKTLVTNMSGTICAENYENGNIFTVKLPVASVEKQLGTKF